MDKDFDPDWVEVFGRACGAYFLALRFFTGRNRPTTPGCHLQSIRCASPREWLKQERTSFLSEWFPPPCATSRPSTWASMPGVMVTASHNPPEFNGFKVIAGPSTIHGEEIQSLYRIMAAGGFPRGKGIITRHDITPSYVSALASQTRLSRPLKVVVDGRQRRGRAGHPGGAPGRRGRGGPHLLRARRNLPQPPSGPGGGKVHDRPHRQGKSRRSRLRHRPGRRRRPARRGGRNRQAHVRRPTAGHLRPRGAQGAPRGHGQSAR